MSPLSSSIPKCGLKIKIMVFEFLYVILFIFYNKPHLYDSFSLFLYFLGFFILESFTLCGFVYGLVDFVDFALRWIFQLLRKSKVIFKEKGRGIKVASWGAGMKVMNQKMDGCLSIG